MLRKMLVAVIVLCWSISAASAEPVSDPEREAVLATVQQFLDAMAERNAEKARPVVFPEGRFFSIRHKDGAPVIRSFTIEEDIGKWATLDEAYLERIWNAEVRIHGNLATVWTPYDFHRDGRFSHCGIDAFDLLKTADGWKLTGGVYTVETESCPECPLGPLAETDAPREGQAE